jgi:non-heme chloroperoxidase
MPTITTKDGTSIYYKDWGAGQPITFSHGWPLTADAWDAQMLFLGQQGYRVIAHDRRGNGRSSQPWDGNDMDHCADDLAELMNFLNLKNTIMVGHSTGGGEVARYLGRHGAGRAAKAVLISAVPPLMLKSEKNPLGLPLSVFDGLRTSLTANRSQFYQDLTLPFFGYNRHGAKISKGVQDNFWLAGMLGSHKSQYDTIKAFSETDFTDDLKKIDIPVLVLQNLPRLPPRYAYHARRRDQRRPARLHQVLIKASEWVSRLTVCSPADPLRVPVFWLRTVCLAIVLQHTLDPRNHRY